MQTGLRFHHIGIPTDVRHPNERYLPQHKVHVSGYETSPYGIEWMRFEPGSPVPDLVQRVPHVAFEVDDLGAAIAGKEILIQPNSPSEGVKVAFIVDNGAPIEFLQFSGKKYAGSSSRQTQVLFQNARVHDHEKPRQPTFSFAGFGTDRLRRDKAMKTAGKGNPTRWATKPST